MELQIQTTQGEKVDKAVLSDQVFSRAYNEPLIHQVVVAAQASARQGTKAQKNRARVSGGGAKPWRQKGTGRARAGTNSSPIWRKGGVTFAAQPRDHSQKVNKKMYRAALSSVLSELVRSERLILVDQFTVETHKTRDLSARIKAMGLSDALIVVADHALDENLYLASRNIATAAVCDAYMVDPVSLMAFDQIVMTVDAAKQIEERLS